MIERLFRMVVAHPGLKFLALLLAWGVWFAFRDQGRSVEDVVVARLSVLRAGADTRRTVLATPNHPWVVPGPNPGVEVRLRGSAEGLRRARERGVLAFAGMWELPAGQTAGDVPIHFYDLPEGVAPDRQDYRVRVSVER